MIKYLTDYGSKIREVEIVKETEKCIFKAGYQGRLERENKVSGYNRYHDTWEQARDFLIKRFEKNLEQTKANVIKYEGYLKELREATREGGER